MKNRLRPCALAAMMLLLLGSRPIAARPIETPASPPPPIAASSVDPFETFFLMPDPANNAQNRSVTRVDPDGGVHIAFSAETTDSLGQRPAYYGYCPGGCGAPTNWTIIPVGDLGRFGEATTLALDAQGRPRMMWFYQTIGGINDLIADGTYHYAACNAGCTDLANWTVSAPLATTDRDPWNVHYFALDGQGGAGFVYQADAPRYVTCEANCINAANWRDDPTDVAGISLYDMHLAYTPEGAPRLLSRFDTGSGRILIFSACDTGCWNMNNWGGEKIADLSYDHDFDLELDSLGRPRVALYSDEILSYLWSNGAPLDAASWSGYGLGIAESYGTHLDLVLNRAGRPHLAFYVDDIPQSLYGLGYGVCADNCESVDSGWAFTMVQTGDEVEEEAPVPIVPGCSASLWMHVGYYPSLAVDAAGNPRLTYSAEHWQGGICDVYTDISLIRFATYGTGGPPIFNAAHHAYLPLAIVKH